MNPDIKDIKPPIDLPSSWTWVWIVLAVFAAAALIAALIVWLRKRPSPVQAEPSLPEMTAWEKAYARLDNLKFKNLIDRAYLKPFYIEIGDIVRHYLEDRFLLKAPEMTTEEFLGSVETLDVLNGSQKKLLKEFLYACDQVKFAKHESSPAEAQKTFELAKQLVDETRGT